ncbi:hypothetical protein B1199_02975 [Pseudoalteromonas ulvae]|uniref:Uncharacterized protein n=1 Tax=Pseudoalteromonas ulvae TaxID=107327 RepID=A0A244CUX7_PSEDV|nr:hypothetical protein B1199_02975 [Pseudoalteromonas ulvae]
MPSNKKNARKSKRNVSNVAESTKQDNITNNSSTLLDQLKIKFKVELIFQLAKKGYQLVEDLLNNLPS